MGTRAFALQLHALTANKLRRLGSVALALTAAALLIMSSPPDPLAHARCDPETRKPDEVEELISRIRITIYLASRENVSARRYCDEFMLLDFCRDERNASLAVMEMNCPKLLC